MRRRSLRGLGIAFVVIGPGCYNVTPFEEAETDGSSTGGESGDEADEGSDSAEGPAPACDDGQQNGSETDVDCGGADCQPCAAGQACAVASDCSTSQCIAGVCTSATCGDGVLQPGEECDVGGQSASCDVDCTFPACGDGVPNTQAGEQCDDGDRSEGCNPDCTLAECGDGIVNAAAGEDCDDSGETETCNANCTAATCGDGIRNVTADEACDTGGNSMTCDDDCSHVSCGDQFVNPMAGEECEDDDDIEGNACRSDCTLNTPPEPKLLLCGTSSRDVMTFVPPWINLQLVSSCTPDADAQAMFVSRTGTAGFVDNIDVILPWLAAGGVILTEYSSSDDVYNAVFGTDYVQGFNIGGCYDRAPTVVQFSPRDPFWDEVPFVGIPLADSGCGTNNIADWEGITPLAGWSETEVSIGYRDHEQGRVWVTEFDWQDGSTPDLAYTAQLLGAMLLNGDRRICERLGWKDGTANWGCPAGMIMPTLKDWPAIQGCITADDAAMFNYYNNVGIAVGGCGCKWNADYCGIASIDTFDGRMCGDYEQLHICLTP